MRAGRERVRWTSSEQRADASRVEGATEIKIFAYDLCTGPSFTVASYPVYGATRRKRRIVSPVIRFYFRAARTALAGVLSPGMRRRRRRRLWKRYLEISQIGRGERLLLFDNNPEYSGRS